MFKPLITFEKWIDPLDPKSKITDRNKYFDGQEVEFMDIMQKEKEKEKREKDEDEEESPELKGSKVFMGPHGIIPINFHNIPSKQYNFWVYHTNFNVSEKVLLLMNKIEGVEVLKLWTRYRGWIGIGRLFNEEEVFENIRKKINSIFNQKEENILKGKKAAIQSLQEVLGKNYKFFDIFESKQGWLYPAVSDSEENLKNMIQKVRDAENAEDKQDENDNK